MPDIENVLKEDRSFPPPREFAASAVLGDASEVDALRKSALEEPEAFWEGVAERLPWIERWHTVLEWEVPFAKWFVGGKINASVVCLDQHLEHRGSKTAILWEGEPGEVRAITYAELHEEVCRLANALDGLGIAAGDRVAIYMPMVPELAAALLACARIGATHSVIFGGFSAEALRDRIQDMGAKCVITADGGFRKGAPLPLKPAADEAIAQCPTVEHQVVLRRAGNEVAWVEGRDHDYAEIVAAASPDHEAVPLDAEHPLFTLYTSGTTGKPKGILHTTGGYLVQASYTCATVFDLKEDDVYWCTADIGWITGHSYIVYGPLSNGATTVMYEGAPTTPHPGRFWEIVERHKVTSFYTAPTAIRTFIRLGDEHPGGYDLSSLRLLGTVGEPINPEAWMWYRKVIGGDRCPIVDTWWQTETGSILITPLPGVTAAVPGSATRPFFGIDAVILDAEGNEVEDGQGGYLVLRTPWPGMLRGIWGDEARYRETYWSKYEGLYFTGDGARKDEHGNIWVMGRVDDVINVSGHRLSTAEVESALVSHDAVAEAAVVGRPDEVRGQAICAFVTPAGGVEGGDDLAVQLQAHVTTEIGALARPAEIRFADALPKTRSGKIMRRLLRDIAAGTVPTGDTTTLEDFTVLQALSDSDEE